MTKSPHYAVNAVKYTGMISGTLLKNIEAWLVKVKLRVNHQNLQISKPDQYS